MSITVSKADQARQKREQEEREAEIEYSEACKQFVTCPVGRHDQRAAAKKRLGSAESKMRKLFADADQRMMALSTDAYKSVA